MQLLRPPTPAGQAHASASDSASRMRFLRLDVAELVGDAARARGVLGRAPASTCGGLRRRAAIARALRARCRAARRGSVKSASCSPASSPPARSCSRCCVRRRVLARARAGARARRISSSCSIDPRRCARTTSRRRASRARRSRSAISSSTSPKGIDRVGLVGFADALADPVVPHDATSTRSRSISTGSTAIRRRFSAPTSAPRSRARWRWRKKDDRRRARCFVLVSDGEDYGEELEQPARRLPQRGATTCTASASVGRRAVVVPDARSRTAARRRSATSRGASCRRSSPRRRCGRSRRSPADSYIRSSTGGELVAGASRAIVKGERRVLGWRTTTEYRDLYPAGLAVAGGRRRRPLVAPVTTTELPTDERPRRPARHRRPRTRNRQGHRRPARADPPAADGALRRDPLRGVEGHGARRLRPPAARRRAGRRQDADGDDARAGDLGEVPAHPAHARPAAGRHPRHAHLRREDGDVPHRAGAGLHEHPARRRDQPRDAEDAERAARGDAGAAGHARRHDVPARRSVLGARHAEPGRAGRRLHAARGAARSLLDDAARRLPERRRGSRHAARAPVGDDDRAARLAGRRRTSCASSSAARVFIDDKIYEYIVRLGRATRDAGRRRPRPI